MPYDRKDLEARSRARPRTKGGSRRTGRVGSAFQFEVAPTNHDRAAIRRLLVIDPGHVNNGIAEFIRVGGLQKNREQRGWVCQRAWKTSPLVAISHVEAWLDNSKPGDMLIIESYMLYPWQMEGQGFSQMGTPEVIGVLRFLHHRRKGTGVLLWMQPATMKKTGQAEMRKKGVIEIGSNQHARDAEYHGWAWILGQEKAAERGRR